MKRRSSPAAFDVLQQALDRGLVAIDDVLSGECHAARMDGADHVVVISSGANSYFWKTRSAPREQSVYDALDEAGLNGIHPELVDTGIGGSTCTRGLKGSSLRDVILADAKSTTTFHMLGRLLGSLGVIEGLDAPSLDVAAFLEDPSMKGLRYLSQGQYEVLLRLRTSPEFDDVLSTLRALPTTFNHGDVRPDNVFILEDGRVALIDWELAGPKWPAFDVATVIAHVFWDRMIPSLAADAPSIVARANATGLARAACAALLDGYASVEEYRFHTQLAFALALVAFEAAASTVRISPPLELMLNTALRVAVDERQTRLLLAPLQ